MKLDNEMGVETIPSIKRDYREMPPLQLEIDFDRYQALLDDTSFDARQRADFLSSLWSIILAFIDLGYRVHPVQQAVGEFPDREYMNREIIRRIGEFWREAA